MSSVYSVTITQDAWTQRAPFKSVGLVCECGAAVAGLEGVMTACAMCGAIYTVTVLVGRSSAASVSLLPYTPGDGEAVQSS